MQNDNIQHNLPHATLVRLQEAQATRQGKTRVECGGCRGTGKVTNRNLTCTQCNGAGYKWRPSTIITTGGGR